VFDLGSELHKDHRKRMRAKAEQGGLSQWADHELLELLLFYAIPRGDTNQTAHRLMSHFGSFAEILNASEEELCSVAGIGMSSAILIRNVAEITRRYYLQSDHKDSGNWLTDLSQLGKFCADLFIGVSEERLYGIYLSHGGKLLGYDLISEGTLSEVKLYFGKMIKQALRYHASVVVLTHNHPGGIARPSNEDVTTTNYLKTLLKMSDDILLADHVIVAGQVYLSMKEGGYFSD
jgi:DNA repair protein RadC